jgi:hypothetical protein
MRIKRLKSLLFAIETMKEDPRVTHLNDVYLLLLLRLIGHLAVDHETVTTTVVIVEIENDRRVMQETTTIGDLVVVQESENQTLIEHASLFLLVHPTTTIVNENSLLPSPVDLLRHPLQQQRSLKMFLVNRQPKQQESWSQAKYEYRQSRKKLKSILPCSIYKY